MSTTSYATATAGPHWSVEQTHVAAQAVRPHTPTDAFAETRRAPVARADAHIPTPLPPSRTRTRTLFASMAQRVFAAMRRRHLAPGHISVAVLEAAMPLSHYEAQRLFVALSGVRRPSACVRADVHSAPELRHLITHQLRHLHKELNMLLRVVVDAQQVRCARYIDMVQLRAALKHAKAQARCGAADPACISALQHQMVQLSYRVYSYPFVG